MTKRRPKKKLIKLKPGGKTLLFTSAGSLRPGQELSLPGPEASRFMAKGLAVEVIKRRKKSSSGKDANSGDAGRDSDTGREPDTPDAMQTPEA